MAWEPDPDKIGDVSDSEFEADIRRMVAAAHDGDDEPAREMKRKYGK